MKFFYFGIMMAIAGIGGVWLEALWLLGGSNPAISTSVDARAMIVIATAVVGLVGAVLALVGATANRRYGK